MFPLGAVVFPFTAVPLRVFEPRYQTLLDSVLADDHRFGMVLIERGVEVGGGDVRFGTGTLVEVVGVEDMDDGHRAIMVAGLERLRVVAWLDDDPHPWAEVERVPFADPPPMSEVDRLSALLDRVLALASELGADVLARADLDVADDPLAAAYQLVALAPLTPLDDQHLLEVDDATTMVREACDLLTGHAELLAAQLADG